MTTSKWIKLLFLTHQTIFMIVLLGKFHTNWIDSALTRPSARQLMMMLKLSFYSLKNHHLFSLWHCWIVITKVNKRFIRTPLLPMIGHNISHQIQLVRYFKFVSVGELSLFPRREQHSQKVDCQYSAYPTATELWQ